MLERNRHALKEWSVICDRLASGDQILLIRKGGILETRQGFRVEHREFFLFPTFFHQGGAPSKPREAGDVEIGLYAECADDIHVTELDRLRGLEGMHTLPWADVEHRFRYGREEGVHVLALRAYRLPRPHVVKNLPAYEGCVSWVELAEELPAAHDGPVLNRTDFRARLEKVQTLLGG